MIIGPYRECNQAAGGARTLPISQRMLAGMPLWRLFQHPILDLAGGGQNRKLTLKPWSIVTEVLYDKDRKRATGVRVLRCRQRAMDRLLGKGDFHLRLHLEFDLAADAIRDRCLAAKAWAAAQVSSVTT